MVRWRSISLVSCAALLCTVGCGGEATEPGPDPDMGPDVSVLPPPAFPQAGAGEAGTGVAVGGTGGSSAGAAGIGGAAGAQVVAGAGGMEGGAGAGGEAGGAGAGAGAGGASGGGTAGSDPPMLEGNFSFFVTSLRAMRELSGSQNGFGGDFGGLSGADQICQTIAMGQGAGHKTWRAFLSATTGGATGGAVHAIDRIGEGPWYDRRGRLVAMNKAGLLMQRPAGDMAIAANLPDENGELLNQNGTDDHDVLTGSNMQGRLFSMNRGDTCNDWTSAGGTTGRPMLGHSWPARSGMNWIQAHQAPGCAAGAQLVQIGPPQPGDRSVGAGGGYGGIYCFALEP
jgi:hypothetical protein